MKFFTFVASLLFASTLFAQSSIIQFQGRAIDLEPYLKGFQYRAHFIDSNSDMAILRVMKDEIDTLHFLKYNSNEPWDMSQLRPLILKDVSKRNIWGFTYSAVTNKFYIMMDERNDEIMNIYSIDPQTLEEKRLTNFAYIYSLGLSADGSRLAYSARLNGPEGTDGEIGYIDLNTLQIKSLYRDTADNRIYFGAVSWSPDGKHIAFVDTVRNNRSYLNLNLVQTDLPYTVTRITSPQTTRTVVSNVAAWVSPTLFYFGVLEGNYREVKKYDLVTKMLTTVAIDQSINELAILSKNGKVEFLVKSGPPYLTLITKFSESGVPGQKWSYQGNTVFTNAVGDEVFFSANSPSEPTAFYSFNMSADESQPKMSFEYPPSQRQKTVHCEFEKISYKTFDGYAAENENGLIHAFLMKPKNPLPKEKQIVMIEAFYGGRAQYSVDHSLFCQAGIYVLSPAPRGSPGWSNSFVKAIEGDLGGNEILDVIEAAKWAETNLKIPASRIGAFGFSHGGYAVMRQLTFPGEVNGHVENFKWGFGISGAGISNITRYHNTGNIPGWVRRMCGEDPNQNQAKWDLRSPDKLASSLHGPLLLLHGENDSRVPVEESRSMARALAKENKTHEYLEFAGEGHGMKLYPNRVKYYSSQFNFISEHVLK
jgi:dipeptidyl aminopeptidase/acylaminoacyl peptidase